MLLLIQITDSDSNFRETQYDRAILSCLVLLLLNRIASFQHQFDI
jgi:hypothetical protein